MHFYKKHVFICTNNNSRQSCYNKGYNLYSYAKNQGKILDLKSKGIRISSSGCLGFCPKGPILVIYPEASWYFYKDEFDIDEIISSLLKEGDIIDRLLIK